MGLIWAADRQFDMPALEQQYYRVKYNILHLQCWNKDFDFGHCLTLLSNIRSNIQLQPQKKKKNKQLFHLIRVSGEHTDLCKSFGFVL